MVEAIISTVGCFYSIWQPPTARKYFAMYLKVCGLCQVKAHGIKIKRMVRCNTQLMVKQIIRKLFISLFTFTAPGRCPYSGHFKRMINLTVGGLVRGWRGS